MALTLTVKVLVDTTQAEVSAKNLANSFSSVEKSAKSAGAALNTASEPTKNFGENTKKLKDNFQGLNPVLNSTRQVLSSLGGDVGKASAGFLGVAKDVTELRGKMVGGGGLVAALGAVGLAAAAVVIAFQTVSEAMDEAKKKTLSFLEIKGKTVDVVKELEDKFDKIDRDRIARSRGFRDADEEKVHTSLAELQSQLEFARRVAAAGGSAGKRALGFDIPELMAGIEALKRRTIEIDREITKAHFEAVDARFDADQKAAAELRKFQQDDLDAIQKRKDLEIDVAKRINDLRTSLIADDEERKAQALDDEFAGLQLSLAKEVRERALTQDQADELTVLARKKLEQDVTAIHQDAANKRVAGDKALSDEFYNFQREAARSAEDFRLDQASKARALGSKARALDIQTAIEGSSPFQTKEFNQRASLAAEFDAYKRDYSNQFGDLVDRVSKINSDLETALQEHDPFNTIVVDLQRKKAAAEKELEALELLYGKENDLFIIRRRNLDLDNNLALRQGRAEFSVFKSQIGSSLYDTQINLNRELIIQRGELNSLDETSLRINELVKTADDDKRNRLVAYLVLLDEERTQLKDRMAGNLSLLGHKTLTADQTESLNALLSTVKQVSNSVEQSLGDAVMAGLTGRNDEIKDIFRNLFMSIANDFTRLALNQIANALLGSNAGPNQNGISGLVQLGVTSALGAAGVTPTPTAAPGAAAAPVQKSAIAGNTTNIVLIEDEAKTVMRGISKRPGETVNLIDATRNKRRVRSRVA
jgi:hypothetical protein